MGSFSRRPYKEWHYTLNQYNAVHLLFKIFLIWSSGGHLGWQSGIILAIFKSLRITVAEVVVILWVHCFKMFFFLITNIFINNSDFAIQLLPIKNI